MASKVCGGFHLAIDNVGRAPVVVRLNPGLVTTVQPGTAADLTQYGNRVPAMERQSSGVWRLTGGGGGP